MVSIEIIACHFHDHIIAQKFSIDVLKGNRTSRRKTRETKRMRKKRNKIMTEGKSKKGLFV